MVKLCVVYVWFVCNIGLIQVYDIKSLIKRHLPYFCMYAVLRLQLQHRIRREVLVVIIFYLRRDVKNIAGMLIPSIFIFSWWMDIAFDASFFSSW